MPVSQAHRRDGGVQTTLWVTRKHALSSAWQQGGLLKKEVEAGLLPTPGTPKQGMFLPWLFPPILPVHLALGVCAHTQTHTLFNALASPLCCINASITGLHCKGDFEGKESHSSFFQALAVWRWRSQRRGRWDVSVVGGRWCHVQVSPCPGSSSLPGPGGWDSATPPTPHQRSGLPPSVCLI